MPTQTPSQTLGDLALEVRCKNAGPFWMTLEAFLPDRNAYEAVAELLTPATIGRLYGVAPEQVQIFRLAALHVVKMSFPRPVSQGSLHDRDLHAGQRHVALAGLEIEPNAEARHTHEGHRRSIANAQDASR